MAEFQGIQFEDEVSIDILHGGHDATLDELERAIRSRKKALGAYLAAQMAAQIEPGTQIRIKADAPLRPKYLIGVPMVVEKVNKTTVTCNVKDLAQLPSTRYAYGIRVPLEHIEVIPAS